MKLQSSLSPKAYLSALKNQMESCFQIGTERTTGWFLGPCFSITHHAGYEFNRRITDEQNSAIGYVRKTDDGCQVCFIRTKGFLHPGGLLGVYLLFYAVMLLTTLKDSFMLPQSTLILISAGLCLIYILVGAFVESFTQRSQEGAKRLTALLIDPSDPFAYLHHQNEL